MAHLAGLTRYPVKGLTGEGLAVAEVRPDARLPLDRRFAFADARAELDPERPAWLPRRNFAQRAHVPGLALLRAVFDPETRRLRLDHPDRGVVEAPVDDPDGRAVLAARVAAVAGRPPDGLRLVEAGEGGFTDVPEPFLSLINRASLDEIAVLAGAATAPERFRANLLVEGWPARREFELVGRRLRIGGVELSVEARIDRCAATCANPETGERDLNPPSLLRRRFGHVDCGVYLRVVTGGVLRVGEAVEVVP